MKKLLMWLALAGLMVPATFAASQTQTTAQEQQHTGKKAKKAKKAHEKETHKKETKEEKKTP